MKLDGLNLEELSKRGRGGLEMLRARVGEGVKGVDLEKLRESSFGRSVGVFFCPIRFERSVWISYSQTERRGEEGVWESFGWRISVGFIFLMTMWNE